MFRKLYDKDHIIKHAPVNKWVLVWTMVKAVVPQLIFIILTGAIGGKIDASQAILSVLLWLIIFAVIDIIVFLLMKKRAMSYSYSNYYITYGLLKSKDMVIPLDQVTAVTVSSDLFGKLFNYGTIVVVAPYAKAWFNGVDSPYDFAIELMEQIERRKQSIGKEGGSHAARVDVAPSPQPVQEAFPINNIYKQSKSGSVNCIAGTYVGASYGVKSGEQIVIGREPSLSHIVINDGRVSKQHVIIKYDANMDAYIVQDVSTNGVFLMNGQRLEAGKSVIMQRGTQIRIGKSDNIFQLG